MIDIVAKAQFTNICYGPHTKYIALNDGLILNNIAPMSDDMADKLDTIKNVYWYYTFIKREGDIIDKKLKYDKLGICRLCVIEGAAGVVNKYSICAHHWEHIWEMHLMHLKSVNESMPILSYDEFYDNDCNMHICCFAIYDEVHVFQLIDLRKAIFEYILWAKTSIVKKSTGLSIWYRCSTGHEGMYSYLQLYEYVGDKLYCENCVRNMQLCLQYDIYKLHAIKNINSRGSLPDELSAMIMRLYVALYYTIIS